jgi:hypothetical protein
MEYSGDPDTRSIAYSLLENLHSKYNRKTTMSEEAIVQEDSPDAVWSADEMMLGQSNDFSNIEWLCNKGDSILKAVVSTIKSS